jgi:hypothetical protein
MMPKDRKTLAGGCVSGTRALRPGLVLLLLAAVLPLEAQSPASPFAPNLSLPAVAWAQQCEVKEERVIEHPGSYLRYRMHSVDEKGDQVREVIETPEGNVARLLVRDGKSVSADLDAAERDRLQGLIDSPSTFARHAKNDQGNRRMGLSLLKMMPDAMLWSYAPGQPQPGNVHGEPLVVLDFKANPNWSPPSIPAEALTGLEGRIWIDARTQQMIQLEATLVRPVNIGWGVLAHLYPGGTVSVHLSQAAGDRWIADRIEEQLVVRALMVKTIRQRMQYDTEGYQAVPAMSYKEAIEKLLALPLPMP